MKTTLKMLAPERVENNERWYDLIGKSPQRTYTNVVLEKKTIFAENKGKSGIYCWTNIKTRKIYIGSSVDLARRFRTYLSIPKLKRVVLTPAIYMTKIIWIFIPDLWCYGL